MPSRSSSRSVRSRFTSARVSSRCLRRRASSVCSSATRGSGPPPAPCASASSMRALSSATFSCRRSASSSWTSESAGLAGSFDIATEPGLKLPQPQVLHLAAQEAGFDLEALDPAHRLVRKPVELAGVDQHAERKLLSILLEHLLVARHSAARDLDLLEAANPAREHV